MANTITMLKSIAEGEGDLTKHLDISIANVRVINRRSTGSAPLGALTYYHNKDR
jgi:hypothetical protein